MSDNRCDLCGESLSLAEYRTGECMNCLEGIAPPASSDNSNELPDSFCFDSGREVDIFDDGSVMFREPNNSPAHYCAQDMQLYLNKEEMEAVIKSYQVLNATATSSDAEQKLGIEQAVNAEGAEIVGELKRRIATQEQEIAELKESIDQAVGHIDNLQFCSEERGFFYCPNCGEGTTHTEDCYIGVFLAKHTKESGNE